MKNVVANVLEEVSAFNAALSDESKLDHAQILALAKQIKLHAAEAAVGVTSRPDRDFLLTVKKQAALIERDAEEFLRGRAATVVL